MLQLLGISQQADAVYRLMVTRPALGVDELVAHLGVTESEVRAALDELFGLYLARESRDHPGRLRAVRPDVAFNIILREREKDVAERMQALAQQKELAAAAVAAYADLVPNRSDDGSERLVGLDEIHVRLEELSRELSSECLSAMPGGAQSQASLDSSRPLDEEAMRRGIDLLTLYQDSARNDAATYAYARWMTENGGQVRTAPVVPPRMLIFDRRVAVIPIDPNNTKLGALCTREPAIIASLIKVFEQSWIDSVPLGADIANDVETGLTATERELLTLLSSGMTDAAAGSRLGISARTVRRLMAALMERLDASSRFEAGLKAARRGWL